MQRECQYLDCDKPAVSRGWCSMHYTRWRRHGDPSTSKRDYSERAKPGLSDWERFERRIEQHDDGCWYWNGHLLRGYGRFKFADGRTMPAHRAAYTLLVGEIPEGRHIDHLCFNRPCVNPEHLEPVTNAENARRVAMRNRREWATCQSGRHPYPENRVLEPSTGRYRCLLCRREAQRRYKAKRRPDPRYPR